MSTNKPSLGLFDLLPEELQEGILPQPEETHLVCDGHRVDRYMGDIRHTYMNHVKEANQERGSHSYLCFRCHKPVEDAKKLIIDQHTQTPYGEDCYSGISERLTGLRRSNPFMSLTILPREALELFKCGSCGREFEADPSAVKTCGGTVRCCFCCPDNSTRNKGIPCSREKAFMAKKDGQKP